MHYLFGVMYEFNKSISCIQYIKTIHLLIAFMCGSYLKVIQSMKYLNSVILSCFPLEVKFSVG